MFVEVHSSLIILYNGSETNYLKAVYNLEENIESYEAARNLVSALNPKSVQMNSVPSLLFVLPFIQ